MKVDSTILAALIGAIIALIAAIIPAILTIRGWRVEQRRLREQQLWESQIEYRRQQIEELYGPLWGMVQKHKSIYEVAKKILPNDGKKVKWDRFQGDDSDIWNFFLDNYRNPIQSEMAQLINAKIHLLENGIMPDSFQHFLEHESVSICLYSLWKATGKSSLEKVAPNPYPEEFDRDVKSMLDQLRRDYDDLRFRQKSQKVR